jgi:hypothetical protein
MDHPSKESSSEVSGMIAGLEKRVAGVTQDFTQAIHKISEKENEKFDLIFAILSELQQRQAHLEESVRSLKAQYGGNGACMVSNGNGNGQNMMQTQQFNNGNGQYGQMNGQMGAQMNGNMVSMQPMQQQCGVMQQPDGSQAMFTQVMQPQQMIIMSPPANGGMQYAAVPQMMTPQGAIVQQMPAGMAMQFIAQSNSQGQDMSYVNSRQDQNCQPSAPSLQAQMDLIKAEPSANGLSEGANAANGQCQQQDSGEVQGQASETSSQEGKLDEGSPVQIVAS